MLSNKNKNNLNLLFLFYNFYFYFYKFEILFKYVSWFMAASQTQSRRLTKDHHRCPNTISETGHSPGKIPRARFRATVLG